MSVPDPQPAIDQDTAVLPAGSSVSGLTPSSASASGTESGNDDSGDLRACVWRVGRSVGRTVYRQTGDGPASGDQLIGVMDTPELARLVVDAVNARRVAVDDDTVERAAGIRALKAALEASRGHARGARQQGLDRETCRFWQGVNSFLRRRISALEAGEEPDWPDAANTARDDLGGAAVQALRGDE